MEAGRISPVEAMLRAAKKVGDDAKKQRPPKKEGEPDIPFDDCMSIAAAKAQHAALSVTQERKLPPALSTQMPMPKKPEGSGNPTLRELADANEQYLRSQDVPDIDLPTLNLLF